MKDRRPVIFGEVLFDHFPGGVRVLGGAPFNVAWHLQAFGQAPLLVSRVGSDKPGHEARTAMEHWGMDTQSLQTDAKLPTGRVEVRFENEEPRFEIVHPSAFDAISPPDRSAGSALPTGVLYHGTLALRDRASRDGLAALLKNGPGLVFVDVNLRTPWWNRRQVLELVRSAHWVKLNTSELRQLGYITNGGEGQAARFLAEHELQGLVLTDGENGAQILTASGDHFSVKPEAGITLVDSVGAGDALTSVILHGLLEQWPLDTALQRAQAFASAICGQRGATVADRNFYRRFTRRWRQS